jgi:hypothetical protein
MARLLLKGVLGLTLLAGLAVLFIGHQLFLLQRVASGESAGERLLVGQLVPQYESALGTETVHDPKTLEIAWVSGGAAAGVGFLGLLVLGLQDSARGRRAARLVPPPVFSDRDRVSSHHFLPEGLRMWNALYRLVSVPCFLLAALLLLGTYPAITHEQWVTALVVFGAAVASGFMGALLWRGNKNSMRKRGVQRLDVMAGGLRWVRHDDPAERTVAWAQVQACTSHNSLQQPWKNTTVVTLRTGETICLWAACLSDYDACVDLVNRGRKEGRVAPQYTQPVGAAGLATAFRFNR